MNLPPIVSADEWQAANEAMIAKEKEATRARDRLNAERRRMPMVKIEKDYTFEGPNGPVTFARPLRWPPSALLYHFMFDPDWDEGCGGCSMFVDNWATPPISRRATRRRARLAGAAGETRSVRGAHGLGESALVLVVRQ